MLVMRRLIEMLTAIQFDDNPRLETDDAADMDAEGMLPPELEAGELAAAQAAPQAPLGLRLVNTRLRAK